MAIPKELINSLLKYRKRRKRPLGPTIPSYAGQCDFIKPVTRVPGDRYIIPAGSVAQPEVYMGDVPGDYVPDVGFMEIPESDYALDDNHMAEGMSHMDQYPLFPANIAEFVQPETVDYEDCLMDESLLKQLVYDMLLEASGIEEYTEGVDPAIDSPSREALPSPGDLTDALCQLQQVFPEDHPDVLRLSAIVQELAYNASMSQSEDSHVGLDSSGEEVYPDPDEVDPFQEAEQIFDQQMQLLDRSFESSAFETIEDQAPGMYSGHAMLEEPMGGIDPAMNGPDSLDDIVEAYDTPYGMANGMPAGPAYDDCLMTPDLFGQAMNEALGPMEDPYMDAPDDMPPEDMYDPMPDPMKNPHMMNPYMMPGPMGPNFMPDPPPGP